MKYLLSLLFLFLITSLNLLPAQQVTQTQQIMPEFKVYPNPTMGTESVVSLKGFQAEDLLLVVYDMMGKELYSRVAISEQGGFLFSLGSEGYVLHPGVYLIVASKNDNVFRQKLIVREG
jgi:hypothetical protein